MNKLLMALLFCFSSQSWAEGYLDLGLGAADTSYSMQYATIRTCSMESCSDYSLGREPSNPYGIIEAGFTMDKVSVFFLHISSIQDNDGGINLVGVKYRLQLF